jgi:hypothetical protein
MFFYHKVDAETGQSLQCCSARSVRGMGTHFYLTEISDHL